MIKGVSMANVRKQLFSTVPNKYNDKNIALHINPEGDTTTIRIHMWARTNLNKRSQEMILNATLRLGLAGKDKNKTKQTKKKCVDLRDLEISSYGITAISTLVNTPKKAFFDYIKSVDEQFLYVFTLPTDYHMPNTV